MNNPQTTVVAYQETVFICSCCNAEKRSIYRHNGRWYCLPCLRELGKKHGIRVELCYDPDGFIEAHRLAERITRIGPPRQDRRRNVVLK
jgi:hypothetical protein